MSDLYTTEISIVLLDLWDLQVVIDTDTAYSPTSDPETHCGKWDFELGENIDIWTGKLLINNPLNDTGMIELIFTAIANSLTEKASELDAAYQADEPNRAADYYYDQVVN